jgi:ComF family protein
VTAGLLHALERFLLPNACVACGRAVDGNDADALVCGLCRSRLRPVGVGCPRCQQPLPPLGPCRFCAEWLPPLRQVRSAVWFDAVARPVVHHLKYDGLCRIGQDMARVIARRIPRPAAGVLVPVPLSPRRQRQRGFNQAGMLARALATLWGQPIAEDLLGRVRETGTQTALGPVERARNMAAAFTARGPDASRHNPREAPTTTVILVDDVLTTGATLVACATALGEVGWTAVDAVTFARAMPYELRVA